MKRSVMKMNAPLSSDKHREKYKIIFHLINLSTFFIYFFYVFLIEINFVWVSESLEKLGDK